MCSHKISLWTPRTRGLTCLHEISCGAPPPSTNPRWISKPTDTTTPGVLLPGLPQPPPGVLPPGLPPPPPRHQRVPLGVHLCPSTPGCRERKKHHRQIAPAISLCRSLPHVRPPRTHAHENRSDSPLPRLLPCPSLLDHGLRIYTPQVPAQPPAAPIRLARERHSPLALISNCPSTRRARRYICHSAAASTPGAPTPIETDYPLGV